MLIVKGALGAMGAGNTSVLMQLLVGMLDAALARQQDLVPAGERTAVALKVDEAPLVLNRGFAETMALKRSAGLETVACWQTDAQWTDREVRDQLDALFAHRVYFATASTADARASAALTMAEFSDTVRPGLARLSALGHPDVRLRLPRHHAIASWITPAGRAAAFVAETIPMRVHPERIAELAAEQAARGGRRMTDLRQPHWDGASPARAPGPPFAGAPAGPAREEAAAGTSPLAAAGPAPALPGTPPPSFRELLELDRASSARRVAPSAQPLAVDIDPGDIAILVLLTALGHALSSQIHRRLAPGKAATTTQRRLKRLADGRLIERLQFHRADGGGVPMCCSPAPAGRAALEARGLDVPEPAGSRPRRGGDALRDVRRELHVAGWALALASLGEIAELRGRAGSALPVPRSPSGSGRALAPAELRLPGGRVPHDFLRTLPGGARGEPERFETLRPDAMISWRAEAGTTLDVLLERDDRVGAPGWVAKLERYDHFLSGWSEHTARYGRDGASAVVVFVCRDRSRARESARRADLVLSACRAYAGDYPHSWQHPGRRGIAFVAERDVHEGSMGAWATPELPPEVRASLSDGDQTAAQARAVPVSLPAPPRRGRSPTPPARAPAASRSGSTVSRAAGSR